MPSAAEIDVAAWPAPNASYSLSRALEESGEAVLLPQRFHARVAAGEELVRISLVPDVPDQLVAWRVEHRVQRHGQLDHAEPRADVATGSRAHVDQALANLLRQRAKLVA